MYLHKKRHGRATTRGRDPMRWKVAALIALALLGIGLAGLAAMRRRRMGLWR